MTYPGTRRTRALFAPGLLLLIFVVATACSSSDPSPDDTPTGDASPPEAAARAPSQAGPITPAPLTTASAAPRPSPTPDAVVAASKPEAAAQAPVQASPTAPALSSTVNPELGPRLRGVPAGDASPPEAAVKATVQAAPTAAPTTPAQAPTVTPELRSSPLTGTRSAPELADTGAWINSEPFTLSEQLDKGNVVLVDFWTYTCINCIRTMPFLREWHEKYADKGLVILGVHTPEFEFEKVLENVAEAVERFGLKYPIVQDNDFGTWSAFDNRSWPAKYLIDVNRTIRYSHFGEGAYDETEEAIRELLVEAGYDIEGIPVGTDPGPVIAEGALAADPGMGHTRELYAGYRRNYGALQSQTTPPYVRHIEYYESPNTDVSYVDPGDHLNHFLYLHGLWRNEAENLVHARATEDYEDYIAIKFYGTSVNVVMAPTAGGTYRVRVTLDDQPIPSDQASLDVMYDDDGQSYIEVNEARMYFLIDQAIFSGGELKLSSNSPEFALFAFTFGSYEGGEPGTDS